MQWRGRRQSGNIEDRRGQPTGGLPPMRGFPRIGFPRSGGPFGGGPLGGGFGRRTGLGGIGTIIIIVLILLFGTNLLQDGDRSVTDPSAVNRPAATDNPLDTGATTGQGGATSDAAREFVAVVLADTEDVWHAQFQKLGTAYQEPTLVLFSGAVESACGFARSATGPFYCPADRKAYIDLSFFRELSQRFGAPGDFAQAYVIAHEIGHHVQNLMGLMDKVAALRPEQSQDEQNALSVRVELQADCFAGVWAHDTQRSKQVLESGDVEEALGAASAVGDDRIQKQTQGYVVPDAFTHGSAEQRMTWFTRGFEGGDLRACDTFAAAQL
jgi:predicted metalloprotease